MGLSSRSEHLRVLVTLHFRSNKKKTTMTRLLFCTAAILAASVIGANAQCVYPMSRTYLKIADCCRSDINVE